MGNQHLKPQFQVSFGKLSSLVLRGWHPYEVIVHRMEWHCSFRIEYGVQSFTFLTYFFPQVPEFTTSPEHWEGRHVCVCVCLCLCIYIFRENRKYLILLSPL